MATTSTFYYGPCSGCGRRRLDDVRCCGRPLDAKRAYKFRFDGSLAVRKPGDPVLWRLRCRSLEQAKRGAAEIVDGFEKRQPPLDAVHRGVVEGEMLKGREPEVAVPHVWVSLSALFD